MKPILRRVQLPGRVWRSLEPMLPHLRRRFAPDLIRFVNSIAARAAIA